MGYTSPSVLSDRSSRARTLLLRLAGRWSTPIAIVIAVAMLAAGAVTTDGFLTIENGKAVLTAAGYVGLISVGMTFITLSGNLFSLSLATTAVVGGMMFLSLLQFGLATAVTATLALGLAIGGIQGLSVGRWGANPILISIAASAIMQGTAIGLTGGRLVQPTTVSTAYKIFSDPQILGLPIEAVSLVIAAALGQVLLKRTRFGREVYLVGSNPRAARAAGVRTARTIMGAYLIAGLCAAWLGVLLGARTSAMNFWGAPPSYDFDAIAALLVGGNWIGGGQGSVLRSLIGALFIAAIADMLLLRGYSLETQLLVKGIIILVALVLNGIRQAESAR